MTRMNPILIALIFAGASFAVFVMAVLVDPFLIFSMSYAWVAVIIPTFIIVCALIFRQIKYKTALWGIVILACLMCGGVLYAHFSLILFFAAGV